MSHTGQSTQRAGPPGQWRLLAPAAVAWLAAALLVGAPGVAAWVLWIMCLAGSTLCALLLVHHWRRRRRIRSGRHLVQGLAVTCAILVLLSARIDSAEQARDGAEITALLNAHPSQHNVSAVLTGFPEPLRGPQEDRFWSRARITTRGGDLPVLLWLNEAPPSNWAPGAPVVLSGEFQRLESTSIAAYAVTVREVHRAGATQPTEILASLGGVAGELRAGLRAASQQIPGAELVPGFAVGDTTLVTSRTETNLRNTSLTHLTAVSGANCALVTGAIMSASGYLGIGRRLRILLAVGSLLGFVVLVGPDASVQRAAVMAGVLLLSEFGGKRARAFPALGIAMIGLLLVDPWQAVQAGFGLSVAATAGILLLVPPLERGLRRILPIPRIVRLPVTVALAAQISCGPLLLLLQPGIPAVGVLANVLAAPAAPMGTGLGLLAALLLPWLPAVGTLAVHLAAIATGWVDAVAAVTTAMPFARWNWPGGWLGAGLQLATVASLIAAWALAQGKISLFGGERAPPPTPWEPRQTSPPKLRLATAVLAWGAIGTICGVVLVGPIAERGTTPRSWVVVACNVGQGDALLLRDPADPGSVMLVDTGNEPELLLKCLERFQVGRIAMLVLSHDDADHVGALEAVTDRVDAALVAPAAADQHENRGVLLQLAEAGVPAVIGVAGMVGGTKAESGDRERDAAEAQTVAVGGREPRWEVLAPTPTAVPATTNAASLVMTVNAAGVSILLLGDTGLNEQEMLLERGIELESSVVKVAHHGSRDQALALYPKVNAETALISVGRANRYGHPHRDVLDALAASGTSVLRTDHHGTVALSVNDGAITAWVEHGG